MALPPSPPRGFLASVGLDPEIVVEFQFNPTQVSDRRAVSYATLTAPGLLMPARQYSQGGDRTLNFTIRIDGLFRPADNELAGSNGGPAGPAQRAPIQRDETGSIEPELNKYRAFLYPRTPAWQQARQSFVSLYEQTTTFESPPLCRFGMGNDRVLNCVVTEVSITELLFNTQLRPLRADVAVTLVEYAPYSDRDRR
jgi:hypothetical protein